MSVQSEITRIQTARNTLRTKAVALGVGLATDNLTQLATKYDGITDRGTPNAEVKEGESYTIQAGYYHGGTVQGVAGGGNYNLQAKTGITPTKNEQTITKDDGYYGLSSVTIDPIPDAYQDVTDVTASASDVLATKVFVDSLGTVTTGTMQNRGAVSQTLDPTSTSYTIPAGYHNGSGTVNIVTETRTVTPTTSSQDVEPTTSGKVLSKVVVNAIPGNYGNATGKTAEASDILYGETAISYDADTGNAVALTGTMPNNGAVTDTLDCGETYTVPAGYHNGSGVITAASLASQTGVDANKTAVTAATMLEGYQGWVNGVKVSGSMLNKGAVTATITGLGSVSGDTSYTIPAGYHNGSGTVALTSDIETALAAI